MPASDTINPPVARYQAVSTRRRIPNSSPGSVIPLAVSRIAFLQTMDCEKTNRSLDS